MKKIFLITVFLMGLLGSWAVMGGEIAPVSYRLDTKEFLLVEIGHALEEIDGGKLELAHSRLPGIFKAFQESYRASNFIREENYTQTEYCQCCTCPSEVKCCKCPACNCWNFKPGYTYVDSIWKHSNCTCNERGYDADSCNCCQSCCTTCSHGSAGFWGSFVCTGFWPCHILQFFIEPCRCSNYEGGECCKCEGSSCCHMGCPLSRTIEGERMKAGLTQMRSFLDKVKETPPVGFSPMGALPPSAPPAPEGK